MPRSARIACDFTYPVFPQHLIFIAQDYHSHRQLALDSEKNDLHVAILNDQPRQSGAIPRKRPKPSRGFRWLCANRLMKRHGGSLLTMMDSRSSLHTTLPSRDGLCSGCGGGGGKDPEMSASVSDGRDATPPFLFTSFHMDSEQSNY
jgi:hypothetical protein